MEMPNNQKRRKKRYIENACFLVAALVCMYIPLNYTCNVCLFYFILFVYFNIMTHVQQGPLVDLSCNKIKKQPLVQSQSALLALQVSRHARRLSATSAVIQKHGGVHGAAPGCCGSCLHVNFPHHVNVSPRSRGRVCGRSGFRRGSSPPLRVQIQLQRTASVPDRRQYPVLDPHWK